MAYQILITEPPSDFELSQDIPSHPLTDEEQLQNDNLVNDILPNQLLDLCSTSFTREVSSPYDTNDNILNVIGIFGSFLCRKGRATLMADIRTIAGDQKKQRQLANHLVAFLKSVHHAQKAYFSISATPNPHVTATSRSRVPAHLEQVVLRRDGYRCVYTGNYDEDSVNQMKVDVPLGAKSSLTRITPIISFALGGSTHADEVEREADIAKTWRTFLRYFPSLRGKINHDSLYQYSNLVTFDVDVREHFESRTIAFQPSTGRTDQYELHKFPADISLPPQWLSWMTLVSSDTSVPLPDPDFFAVHYQIANILEQSGIGAQIRDPIPDDPSSLNPNNSPSVHSHIQLHLQEILPSGAYGH